MANTLATIAKLGVGYLALKQLATMFKSNKLQYDRNAVRSYATKLATAKDDKEALLATMGLLNIASTVLSKVDKLRFLGTKVKDVVNSVEYKKYIDSL